MLECSIFFHCGAVIFLAASVVFAEGMKGGMMDQKKKSPMMGDRMMGGDMMGEGMMGKGMMGGMMMKSMMEKTMVATSDGGIIVLAGNKLTKYDKDLNVVKEVELKVDMEGMQKMMDNMKSMCPMMRGMMGDMKEDASHHPENK